MNAQILCFSLIMPWAIHMFIIYLSYFYFSSLLQRTFFFFPHSESIPLFSSGPESYITYTPTRHDNPIHWDTALILAPIFLFLVWPKKISLRIGNKYCTCCLISFLWLCNTICMYMYGLPHDCPKQIKTGKPNIVRLLTLDVILT